MMAIEKNGFKATRFDPKFSAADMYSDEEDEELVAPSLRGAAESDGEEEVGEGDEDEDEEDNDEDEDEFNDADSGAGSDDFDLLELGDSGSEFCQVGSVTCSVPFELYDLPGLEDVLSMDVWNEVLTEEEKLGLTKFLPDMDQLTFMRTLKELFGGDNFHFGSPMKKLFDRLKGGLCEPRVALYREGLTLFQKRQHYHLVRRHHNTMIGNVCQIRDAWLNCKGYSIEEKLRVLNILKSQKSLMHEKVEKGFESDPLEESGDRVCAKKVKNRNSAVVLGRTPGYGVGSTLEFASRMPVVGVEVAKHGKQKRLAGAKLVDQYTPAYEGMHMNSGPYGPAMVGHRQSEAGGYDIRRGKMRVDYDEDEGAAPNSMYGMRFPSTHNALHGSGVGKSGFAKAGKKHDLLRNEALAADSFMGSPFSVKNDYLTAYGRNRSSHQLPDVNTFRARPSSMQSEFERRAMYPENLQQYPVGDQMKSLKRRAAQLPVMNSRFGFSEYSEPNWHAKIQGQAFPMEPLLKHDDWNMSIKKLKKGRESPELNFQHYRDASPQISDAVLLSDLRKKSSKEKHTKIVQNGGPNRLSLKAKYHKDDETESDSSEYFDQDDEDDVTFIKKKAYASNMVDDGSQKLSSFKYGIDSKKSKSVRKNTEENEMGFNGTAHVSRKVDSFNGPQHMVGYPTKGKKKGTPQSSSPLHSSTIAVLEDSPVGQGKLKDIVDRKRTQKASKNGQPRVESVSLSSSKAHSIDPRHKVEGTHFDPLAEEQYLRQTQLSIDEYQPSRMSKRGHKVEVHIQSRSDRPEASLQGCSSGSKKRKAKEEAMSEMDGRDEDGHVQSIIQQPIDEPTSLKKKGKRKLEPDAVNADMEISQLPVAEAGPPAPVVEAEIKPVKKPYIPITPTVHTGFSFSIVHLLTAVRMAMVSPLSDAEKPKDGSDGNIEGSSSNVVPQENADGSNKSENASQTSMPLLTVPEIVNRLRSNPGDPCILETQEPLQDLVRGVLKIFSSKTAPLGAKGWKALVGYEKSNKSWSWIGPLSETATDHENNDEVTSPDYWGIPHKMLVKLVDSFANWLKSGQETLQQIGSLPAPPLSLMQCNMDEKERFRDLRAQKSLNTISLSPEEVRDYFRKEEVLRYSVPDRAFQYTAADGKKSIVAPLRRCGGKPTSKARDHFMLKRDRPPHVTILCLVRDAAARLPGSIGTRADVCTLIRDSQYIVEDVSDAQVNQVVSGALDRLHYERDPCVQFDGERKLWVYLHRDREEEDFEDDGTSSTKKWKRQKKDPADQPEQETVTVAFHGTEDQLDLGSDLNAEPPITDGDKKGDNLEGPSEAATLVQDDAGQSAEDNVNSSHEIDQGNAIQEDITWEALNLNPEPESKLLCQENSTNEDFGDESFGREGSMELLGAS